MNKYLITFVLINLTNLAISLSSVAEDKLPRDYSQLQFSEVGSAKFSVFFWDIYNSTLYTKSGSYLHTNSPDSLIFEIEYLKGITTVELLDRTIQQWKHLKVPESKYSKFVPTLEAIWPDISSGDKLALLVKNKQSVFYFNGVRIGHIEEKEFSKLFLDIWLSPETSQQELRRKLLGE